MYIKEWKSIEKDGKPKKSGEYLVTINHRVDVMGFTTNPYRLDRYDFEEYKGKRTDGIFYSYDSEWGYSDWPDAGVTAWMKLPKAYEEG